MQFYLSTNRYSGQTYSLFDLLVLMSSQIIGELGQVGLTVPKKDPVPNQEPEEKPEVKTENKDILKRRVSSTRSTPSKYRVKRFRQEWMLYDIFKDWLRPHSSSPELALCIVCNRTIKAGKSELEKHATGKKHYTMLKSSSNQLSTSNINLCRPTDAPQPEFTAPSYTLTENGGSSPQESVDNIFMEGQLPGTSPLETSRLHQSQSDSTSVSEQEPSQSISQYCPAVTKLAPHWKAMAVVNGHVTTLDLNDYKGHYLLLVFYTNDFCRISGGEINALSEISTELRFFDVDIVACSVDSHLSHLAWSRLPKKDGGIPGNKIALLSDPTHSISKDYGVYLPEKGYSLRAHFLIDKAGFIRQMGVNDTGLGRGIDEIKRLVRALIFHDSTEESCPVDWQPTSQ